MNWEQPLQLPDSPLCQLPALIICRWVPGSGVYIKYLALPLLPLAVYKRQTWDTLKPGPRSPSSPKPSGLAQPARGRAGNAGSHKGSLNLDARNQRGKKRRKKSSSEDTCTPCFGVAFHSLFAKFSKQNQRHTQIQPPPRPRPDPNPELHKNTFSGPAFTLQRFSRRWLADCTCSNMCSEWATLPVNRLPTAQTENMHSSLGVAASNHWLACVSTHTHTHIFFFKGWKKKLLI